MVDVGAEIRRIRKSQGKTLDVLSAESGVDRATISSYENNRYIPNMKTTARILDALGYDLCLKKHEENTVYVITIIHDYQDVEVLASTDKLMVEEQAYADYSKHYKRSSAEKHKLTFSEFCNLNYVFVSNMESPAEYIKRSVTWHK